MNGHDEARRQQDGNKTATRRDRTDGTRAGLDWTAGPGHNGISKTRVLRRQLIKERAQVRFALIRLSSIIIYRACRLIRASQPASQPASLCFPSLRISSFLHLKRSPCLPGHCSCHRRPEAKFNLGQHPGCSSAQPAHRSTAAPLHAPDSFTFHLFNLSSPHSAPKQVLKAGSLVIQTRSSAAINPPSRVKNGIGALLPTGTYKYDLAPSARRKRGMRRVQATSRSVSSICRFAPTPTPRITAQVKERESRSTCWKG
ncbi:hypothetical protein F4861DRAFT_499179 [Xylaria intraflava]|nr:hypothetical protein F4861DRAFT_499179 [Xylaria intraflava]